MIGQSIQPTDKKTSKTVNIWLVTFFGPKGRLPGEKHQSRTGLPKTCRLPLKSFPCINIFCLLPIRRSFQISLPLLVLLQWVFSLKAKKKARRREAWM